MPKPSANQHRKTHSQSGGLRSTGNTLPANVRAAMVDLLSAPLASALDLRARAKHAHWNVRGATFLQLHELFDKVAAQSDSWADDLAERAVALGGMAQGTIASTLHGSALPETGVAGDAAQHVRAIADSLAAFGDLVRRGIGVASSADPVTADILTGVSGEADKLLWFVESHVV